MTIRPLPALAAALCLAVPLTAGASIPGNIDQRAREDLLHVCTDTEPDDVEDERRLLERAAKRSGIGEERRDPDDAVLAQASRGPCSGLQRGGRPLGSVHRRRYEGINTPVVRKLRQGSRNLVGDQGREVPDPLA